MNLDKIKEHNRRTEERGYGFKKGVNKFADMTVDELNTRYLQSSRLAAPKNNVIDPDTNPLIDMVTGFFRKNDVNPLIDQVT